MLLKGASLRNGPRDSGRFSYAPPGASAALRSRAQAEPARLRHEGAEKSPTGPWPATSRESGRRPRTEPP